MTQKLIEALEPFARAADECEGAPDEMAIGEASYEVVTVGDCRRARALVSAHKARTEGDVERVARVLCIRQDPDELIQCGNPLGEPADYPAWMLWQPYARAILAAFPALSATQDEGWQDIRDAAQFLCDRLDEMDFSLSMEDFAREHSGHVEPAHERLKAMLAAAPSGETE
jgi:hypothetical protein